MKISVQKYPLIEEYGYELAVVPVDSMMIWLLPHTIAAKLWLIQSMRDIGYEVEDDWMNKWNATFIMGLNAARVLLSHPGVPRFGLARLDELRAQEPIREDAAILGLVDPDD